MRCLKLTSLGGQNEWLVPGEGMRFWQHKPGETRIAFPARDNYAICKEAPDEIVAQLEALDEQPVRVEGMELIAEAALHYCEEAKR